MSTARRPGTSSTGRPVEPSREEDGAVQSRRMLRYDGHPEVSRGRSTDSVGSSRDGKPWTRGCRQTTLPGWCGLVPGCWSGAVCGCPRTCGERWIRTTVEPRARARAAHLQMRAAHVLSHESAARELGQPILTPDQDPHPCHPTWCARPAPYLHGVKHHLAPYQSDQVVVVEGVPVLDAARTAVDMAPRAWGRPRHRRVRRCAAARRTPLGAVGGRGADDLFDRVTVVGRLLLRQVYLVHLHLLTTVTLADRHRGHCLPQLVERTPSCRAA